jgi:hypothetical protein
MEVHYLKRKHLHGGRRASGGFPYSPNVSFEERNEYFDALATNMKEFRNKLTKRKVEIGIIHIQVQQNDLLLRRMRKLADDCDKRTYNGPYPELPIKKMVEYLELIDEELQAAEHDLIQHVHARSLLLDFNDAAFAKFQDECERSRETVIINKKEILPLDRTYAQLIARKSPEEDLLIFKFEEYRDPYGKMITMLMTRNYDSHREFILNILRGVLVFNPFV